MMTLNCTNRSVPSDGTEKASIVGWIASLLGTLVVTSCGSSTSTGNNVSEITGALTLNPDASPVSLDSVNKAAASASHARTAVQAGDYGGSLDLRLVKAAGSGDNFGTIQGWQCSSDSQMAYFTLNITNNGSEADFVGTFKYRTSSGFGWAKNQDIIKSVSTAGIGTVTVNNSDKSLSVVFTGGNVNKLGSSAGWVFAWNSSGLACGKKSGGSAVPFLISIDSTTKKKSLGDSTSDTSLCASLPDVPTYTTPASLSGDEVWNCSAPTGSTAITGVSAGALEDKGGADCDQDGSFFKDSSVTESDCSDAETASNLMCRLNVYYSIAQQASKQVKRQLECKFEGVAQMAKDGDISGFTGGVTDEAKYHVLDMTIGGR